MDVTLYTTHCPKCGILEKKLASKNIKYEEVSDTKLSLASTYFSIILLTNLFRDISFSAAILSTLLIKSLDKRISGIIFYTTLFNFFTLRQASEIFIYVAIFFKNFICQSIFFYIEIIRYYVHKKALFIGIWIEFK